MPCTVERMHPARRRFGWPLKIAFAVLAGLVIALAIDIARHGGPARWLADRGLPQPYLAVGESVDIGGRSLYLDCRGAGGPTIVLEAGAGSDASTWVTVHDDLAAIARTCAYDRAGRGRSDPRGLHTVEDAVADLRALLSAAGERGPYLLTGHSLGGVYVRVFAATHRDDVTGIVLVDAFNPDLQDDWIHPLLGDLRPEYERGLDGLRDTVALWESLDWPTSEAQLRAASVVGLPIGIVVAPRHEPRLDEQTNEAIAEAWRAAFERLSPGMVDHEYAWGAGHMVQFQRPDLVVEVVRRLVEHARTGADRPATSGATG
jgi:pimeloyl-ACP methyl ester carboxylesterase